MAQLRVRELGPLAQALAQAGRPLALLDVREPWEVALARIELPGVPTLTIRMSDIPRQLDDLDPTQSIVCICHHGTRSQQVVAFLQRQGFDAVYNLVGGTDAWSLEVDPSVPRY
jgi:rhodanese-related sulfurtransferase